MRNSGRQKKEPPNWWKGSSFQNHLIENLKVFPYNWRQNLYFICFRCFFNVVPKRQLWHETNLGLMTCWYLFPWLQNWKSKDAMFRDQWKPLVDNGIKPLVNGNEERPGSTFKFLGNIIKSRLFDFMISRDSRRVRGFFLMQKVGDSSECGWFHVVIQMLFMLFHFFHMFDCYPRSLGFRSGVTVSCQATSDWRVMKSWSKKTGETFRRRHGIS